MTQGRNLKPGRMAERTRRLHVCPKGVGFDLDGTLVDTAPEIHQAINQSLMDHQLSLISIDHCRALIGRGTVSLVESIAWTSNDRDRSSVWKTYQVYYEQILLRSRLFPGVERLLTTLVKRGVELIVVTNKPQDQSERILAHLCPSVSFARVLGAREGHALKPSQDLANELDELGWGGDSWAFVGDTQIDMEFAKRARMIPCAAAWGYRGRAELMMANPTLCASSPAELMAQLRCQQPTVTDSHAAPSIPLDEHRRSSP